MRLVIFDCDGTLVDSAATIVSTMGAAFTACGLPGPDHDAVTATIGLSLEIGIARLLPEAPEQVGAVANAYRAEFATGGRARAHDLFAGAEAAILALRARDDHLLAIATGKSRRGLDAVIAHHGFAAHFVATATADDAPSKPHPGMVLKCLAETGIDARNALVVGDTSFDMEMARNAGALALGVDWGSHGPEELRGAGASAVVTDFADLLPAVDLAFARAA